MVIAERTHEPIMTEAEADVLSDPLGRLGDDIFLAVAAMLPLEDVARALLVAKAWQQALDQDADLWQSICAREWRHKVYVPRALRAMAAGISALQAVEEEERQELMRLRARELKDQMRLLNLRDEMASLVEKCDFAEAILRVRRQAAADGTTTQKLLRQPLELVRHTSAEVLPKAALRLSLADAKRTRITVEELMALTFSIRVRSDGPLAEAAAYDPWWLNKGSGEARFERGAIRLSWPADPDPNSDGEPLNPFVMMGMSGDMAMDWSLELNGSLVQIFFHGQPGPQEIVCRHPINWGWVLYSQGTCWTSWPMPPCRDGACADPLLRDGELRELPSEIPRDY